MTVNDVHRLPASTGLVLLMVLQTLGASMLWWSVWLDARAVARAICAGNPPLETRVMSRADLDAQRVGRREVRLNGAMYDIVSQESVATDSVRLVMYRDRKEERILAALPAFLALQDASAPEKPLHSWWKAWKTSSFIAPDLLLPVFACAVVPIVRNFPGNSMPGGLVFPPDPYPPEPMVHEYA